MPPHVLAQRSISREIPVKLDALSSEGHQGIAADTIVGTIWAISKFFYTGDNEVEVIRYHVDTRSVRELLDSPSLTQSSIKYLVERNLSPAEIAKNAQQTNSTALRTSNPGDNASASNFAQILREAPCLITNWEHLEYPPDGDSSATGQPALQLFVRIQADSVQGCFHITDNRMILDTITHVAKTVQQVCHSVLQDWNTAISIMNYLHPSAFDDIVQWKKIPKNIMDACLGDIILQQADARPCHKFVEAWDGELTFAELRNLSLKLAAALLEMGVVLGERIIFCMTKSKWAVVAMLGILLAGGTCIPVDISSPQKRTAALVNQTSARYAVLDENTAPLFQDIDIHVVRNLCDLTAGHRTRLNMPQVPSSAAAFIYFTSGSTGTPRGAVQQHGPLYAKLVELSKAFSMDAKSRIFQYSNHIFDPYIGDIFGAMVRGGCVCIPSEEQRLNNLSETINAFRATHACLTNSVIAHIQTEKVPSLHHLFVGGEPLDKTQLGRWADLLNLNVVYGTTESLIYDTITSCAPNVYQEKNVGREFGPCIWIVDASDPTKLKPVGAIGEILIEGPLIAKEYLNDPEISEAKFISAPRWLQRLRTNEHVRCYRTGDLGYHNADGTLTFIGRADTQVKILGQRVELGEIEHSIKAAEHSLNQVTVEAVSIAGRRHDNALTAFIRCPDVDSFNNESTNLLAMEPKRRDEFEKIRSALYDLLPYHMVPALFVPVREMPLTPTGKLARKTLRQWITNLPPNQIDQYYLNSSIKRKPETEKETCLQQMWAKVLNAPISSVGAEDHFFSVGGDSIKAMELVALLQENGMLLTVTDVFRLPRLCAMATALGTAQTHPSERPTLQHFALPESSPDVGDCLNLSNQP